MHLNGKFINLHQLRDEARAAGVISAQAELGTFGDYLFTYDETGNPADLDAVKLQPIILAHVPVRPLSDAEVYTLYAQANDAGDKARMANLVAQARGTIPRETVPLQPPVTP